MGNYDVQKEVTDKYSLRGRVFNRIREDILSGKFKRGEELKETAIASELGVSRTPVREALRQLELEGLVNIIPNKGAYVMGITSKDVKDIYQIRSLLEGLCARWAASLVTDEQLDELEEIIYLSEFHAEKEHFDQVLELDNKFHELMYNISGSQILEHVLSDFHHYVQRVRKITMATKSRALKSNEEHKQIVEALKLKDADKAEALANQHMMNTIKNLSNYAIDDILGQGSESGN
ncbi:GntR family transcriptional regulator [Anaerobium acetethylicum]|uniref:DNA-binding transcriptional regulator, GntR family n=1 Tax=Anaerobium acetethylicum TaxID=1619234 RepID=A0A1D3TPA6_9FIRM|nr:GntR family transcriptional regulator [Anaerobium acetethylicum]SCP95235.1 DNA-binding transcriptional regulator, GntR family [Anaerobium acetethylicum]